MKKYISILLTIFLCLIVYGCEKTKVTFNYNCPGASIYKCDVVDKKINCTFTMPECGDKEFIGWYDKPVNGTRVNLDKDFTESTTLYAYWNDKETEKPVEEPEPDIETYYNLVFNANGGSGGENDRYQLESGSTLPEISKEKPVKDGYTFMGWYDNSDYTKGTQYYDENCNRILLFDKEDDLILYAGWKENSIVEEPEPEPEQPPVVEEEKYTITFNANGGSGGQSGTLSTTYNAVLPTISKAIPSKTGYTFKGWYDNSDYTKGTQYYNEKNEAIRVYNKKSNTTLYAGWSKVVIAYKYTVKFNINNGIGTTPSDVTAILGNAMPAITSSIPTKSGYTFMGWYDNSNYLNGTQYYTAQNKSARAYDRMSGITLYAGWKDNSYTVSFSPNGGSGGQVNSVNVKYGSNMPTISTVIPIRAGYTFMGWYDNTDYTKGTQYYTAKCASARTYNKASNTTLYAGWKESSYANVNYSNFKWKYYKKKTGPVASYESNIGPYAIWAPENVSDLNGVSLPLIVWLHGSGETTDKAGESTFLGSGLLKVMKNWNSYKLSPVPAIIVAPQSAGWWSSGSINKPSIRALVKYAKDTYNIDSNKIVLMGHSMGGSGVIEMSWELKDIQFSSLVIMSTSKAYYKKGQGGEEFYAKQRIWVYAENKSWNQFAAFAKQPNNFTYYNANHGAIPEKAMIDDSNKDGTSDLIYWLFGEDAKIK